MATIAPRTQLEMTEWKNFATAMGLSATAAKSIISLRTVSGLKCMPAGFCIQPLATRIHQAEMVAPRIVIQVAKWWKRSETLPQPKNITTKNVASRKKATIPSMASGAPKMSPTKWE